MRRFTLLLTAFVLGTTAMKAQTVASFEALSLASANTFYTNYTASGADVGFHNGLVRFPCVYDTSWGGYWEQGFAYSNMTDSTTSGFMNQYSAKAGSGRAGSGKYAVAYCYNPATFENNVKVKLTGIAMGHPVQGFYITNNTYAYNSMRDGDGFARKFHSGDWFKLTVKGYYHGILKTDSVSFYLADFLHPDSADNYIVKTWEWLNLEPLGKVDSMLFKLSSTDNGSFGMNTPAYFCMDDFTTYETFDTTSTPTTVATFETLSLAHPDTFYTNYTASGTDVGFDNGLAHFHHVWDTSWGGFWEQGYSYSNMTDSVTSGFMNQYSAKTAIGHANSSKYAVAYCYNPATFQPTLKLKLNGIAMGHPVKGFYITNSTYAYNSMRYGDAFARKFHNGDWFKLMVRGYYHGALTTDSLGIYLANFLHPDSNNNYILKTWKWLNLEPLGKVDSLLFELSSTDNGSFGMNTPAYFCMDDFTTYETFDTTTPPTSIAANTTPGVKVYPNPAKNRLYVDLASNNAARIVVSNMAGTVVSTANTTSVHNEINTATLPAGIYLLQVLSEGRTATMRFVKE